MASHPLQTRISSHAVVQARSRYELGLTRATEESVIGGA
jgi:isopentenyldiphosphate isomerase